VKGEGDEPGRKSENCRERETKRAAAVETTVMGSSGSAHEGFGLFESMEAKKISRSRALTVAAFGNGATDSRCQRAYTLLNSN
jgi:hypothetical protein